MTDDNDLIRRGDARKHLKDQGYIDAAKAIAALPAAAPRVKPLVWEASVIDKPWHSAKAPWGWYYAQWDDETQAYFASLEMGEIEAPIILSPSDVPTLDAAKAAAQADYEARILAALEPVAAPELKRIGTGLYETQPAVSAPAEDAKAKGETAGETLERLGMDGAKWAAEFRTTALRLGYSDMDEGWLIGWFANAIMAGYDRKPDPAAPIRMEDMTLADLMRDPAYGAASQPDPAAIREAWEKVYWRMRSYAVHDNDCKLNKPPHFDGPCSCGLTAALEEALALIPKGAAEPTEYERKVAQMKKDFPNGI